MKSNSGFTLMEIMIAFAIIAVVSVALWSAYTTQLAKAHDSRRKEEIKSLQKVLEDYYTDKGAYPTPVSGTLDGLNCQNNQTGLRPYIQLIPCDPAYPSRTYLYINDDSSAQAYRIYAQVENLQDIDVKNNPCGTSGCTITSSQGTKTYYYVIASPNVNILTPIPTPAGVIP